MLQRKVEYWKNCESGKNFIIIKKETQMNKLYFFATLLAMLLLLDSCSKNEFEQIGKGSTGVTITNIDKTSYPLNKVEIIDGTLKFSSIELYEDVIQFLGKAGDESFDEFEMIMNYYSFKNNNVDKSKFKFTDPLFFTLLNSNAQIIIEDKIYQVDFAKEVVYELPLSGFNMKKKFDISTAKIHSFSEEILGGNYNSNQGKGLFGKDVKADVQGGSPNYETYHIKVCYQAAGLYFSIVGKITNGTYGGFNVQALTNGTCTNSKGTYSLNESGSLSSHESSVRPYNSTRQLTSYYCTGTFYEFGNPTSTWSLINNQ